RMAVDDALRSFGIQQRPRSNALWAAFDNTEGRLRGRERHIVGHNRLGKAFQGDRANLFSCDASFERDVDALAEQDLTVPGLTAEPSRNIARCRSRYSRIVPRTRSDRASHNPARPRRQSPN